MVMTVNLLGLRSDRGDRTRQTKRPGDAPDRELRLDPERAIVVQAMAAAKVERMIS
jgi:hypothetical protein